VRALVKEVIRTIPVAQIVVFPRCPARKSLANGFLVQRMKRRVELFSTRFWFAAMAFSPMGITNRTYCGGKSNLGVHKSISTMPTA